MYRRSFIKNSAPDLYLLRIVYLYLSCICHLYQMNHWCCCTFTYHVYATYIRWTTGVAVPLPILYMPPISDEPLVLLYLYLSCICHLYQMNHWCCCTFTYPVYATYIRWTTGIAVPLPILYMPPISDEPLALLYLYLSCICHLFQMNHWRCCTFTYPLYATYIRWTTGVAVPLPIMYMPPISDEPLALLYLYLSCICHLYQMNHWCCCTFTYPVYATYIRWTTGVAVPLPILYMPPISDEPLALLYLYLSCICHLYQMNHWCCCTFTYPVYATYIRWTTGIAVPLPILYMPPISDEPLVLLYLYLSCICHLYQMNHWRCCTFTYLVYATYIRWTTGVAVPLPILYMPPISDESLVLLYLYLSCICPPISDEPLVLLYLYLSCICHLYQMNHWCCCTFTYLVYATYIRWTTGVAVPLPILYMPPISDEPLVLLYLYLSCICHLYQMNHWCCCTFTYPVYATYIRWTTGVAVPLPILYMPPISDEPLALLYLYLSCICHLYQMNHWCCCTFTYPVYATYIRWTTGVAVPLPILYMPPISDEPLALLYLYLSCICHLYQMNHWCCCTFTYPVYATYIRWTTGLLYLYLSCICHLYQMNHWCCCNFTYPVYATYIRWTTGVAVPLPILYMPPISDEPLVLLYLYLSCICHLYQMNHWCCCTFTYPVYATYIRWTTGVAVPLPILYMPPISDEPLALLYLYLSCICHLYQMNHWCCCTFTYPVYATYIRWTTGVAVPLPILYMPPISDEPLALLYLYLSCICHLYQMNHWCCCTFTYPVYATYIRWTTGLLYLYLSCICHLYQMNHWCCCNFTYPVYATYIRWTTGVAVPLPILYMPPISDEPLVLLYLYLSCICHLYQMNHWCCCTFTYPVYATYIRWTTGVAVPLHIMYMPPISDEPLVLLYLYLSCICHLFQMNHWCCCTFTYPVYATYIRWTTGVAVPLPILYMPPISDEPLVLLYLYLSCICHLYQMNHWCCCTFTYPVYATYIRWTTGVAVPLPISHQCVAPPYQSTQ